MPTTVRRNGIVDALEMQFDESSSFLDRDTGQVETVFHVLLREAEESGDDRMRGDLLHAIHGAGAFQNFKDTLRRHRINWSALE
jgi:hypothetical protein